MDIAQSRVTSETIQRFKQETAKDPVLAALCDVVATGWPAESKEAPEHLRQYWSFRDGISVYDGVVHRSHQVMFPSSLREEMLHKIHKAHQGADSSIMVDYYSDYIELDSLSGSTSANSVIRAMKRQFARHGIPDELITVNGPQFESHEYSRFAGECGFTIVKSSPYYSRENGKAELAVKIAKNILKKSRKEDPYLAHSAYRNTPHQGYNYSPAQRLMSRGLKDIIPTAKHQLTPQTASLCLLHGGIAERRGRSMAQYNMRASQPLREFSKGKKCLWNRDLDISTNLGYLVNLLEGLDQDLAM